MRVQHSRHFTVLLQISTSELSNSTEVKKLWALEKVSQSELWPQFVERYTAALASEGKSEEERQTKMNGMNPCYILRNWIAQQAIEKAEKDDFSWVRRLEKILQRPYERQEEAESLGYGGPAPKWEKELKVSCSS